MDGDADHPVAFVFLFPLLPVFQGVQGGSGREVPESDQEHASAQRRNRDGFGKPEIAQELMRPHCAGLQFARVHAENISKEAESINESKNPAAGE
jgi:hypothetical protein